MDFFSYKDLNKHQKIFRLSLFSALAVTVFVIESFIPKPMPFLKLGLANVIVITLIYKKMIKSAIFVAVIKVFAGGFFSGTLFSPTTLMAFGGSLVSVLFMIVFYFSKINFSIIGLSVLGAVSHNITQLLIVRRLIIREDQIFYLIPFLIITGIITGIFTGYISNIFINYELRDYYEKIST